MSVNAYYRPQKEDKYLASLTGSDTALPPHQEEEKISQQKLSQWENAITQLMKSLYTLKFWFPPIDPLFTRAPPKSKKEQSYPLFLWICV